jgi:hypothetical protein
VDEPLDNTTDTEVRAALEAGTILEALAGKLHRGLHQENVAEVVMPKP